MRTTVDLDPALLAAAKRVGLDAGRSLSNVVEDALQVYLARRAGGDRPPVELPVFRGACGLRPGVDLEDKEALTALLDEPEHG